MSCSSSSGNNANGIPLLYMAHHQELTRTGLANREEAFFACGVIWISHRDGQRIPENGGCFLKLETVLPFVAALLSGIPCEAHL